MSEPVAAEVPPHTNGVPEDADDDERGKMRPADIDADVKEMEKRKRVEMIMGSRLFREELERIIESQMKDGGGPAGLIQQLQDMVGGASRLHAGAMFKNSSCVVPINDIRGVESMGYAKGEKLLRCKLACVFRLMDLYGWTHGIHNHITARLNQEQEHFLVNPFGMLYHEITASSLVKVDMQGNVVEQGTTNFGVDTSKFQLHGAVHAARPDVKCVIHIHTPSVVAISSLKAGLLPLGREAAVLGEVSTHRFFGGVTEPEERDKIARSLGPINKVLLLSNAGALCCGETVEEAFYNVYNTVLACETQVKLMPMGIDNLEVLPDEARKAMYDAARKAPDGALPKNVTPLPPALEKKEKKWRIGGMEFEALMRMLDNAGFRTGYIYRTPLVKGEPPKPRNDVEVPPAVSSLGYLFEEEEMYRQGQWKKGAYSKNDRTRWLNSPNVYQKVEILETGTTDPKKITKWVDANNQEEWVAESSPKHTSTPVRIDAALQFVPTNTNPKEFKKLQQQIKENRRADKITSGPQSHILEGVTWEEAKKLQDATISMTGDHVIQIGAASKGIIQRGFQHNATVYKTPYAKNPFDCVSDAELEDYKKVVNRKQKGDYYDEDASESEPLSSSAALPSDIKSPPSETEDDSRTEPRVLRIETKTAPVPSQAEVVLSDVEQIDALLEQVEHDLPDPHVERSKSHRFPPVEDEKSNGPVKLKVKLLSLKDLRGWKKQPSPIQEEEEEGEKQDAEIGEKFLKFTGRKPNLGTITMYCSQNESRNGRGDCVKIEDSSIVVNERKRNRDLGMDGGDDGGIKKEKLHDQGLTVAFDMPKSIPKTDIVSEKNKSIKNSASSQNEECSRDSNDSTYSIHCTCCCKRLESREISTQTKLRMWSDESENEAECGATIPFPPALLSAPNQRCFDSPSTKLETAHKKTHHEEEIERRRSAMFAIHNELTKKFESFRKVKEERCLPREDGEGNVEEIERRRSAMSAIHQELKMKFESLRSVKIKEEPAPSVLMDDVEEVSISVYSHSLVLDNKTVAEAGMKTGFSSDDTGNSGEFPSLEEDRHEEVDSNEKDTSMQDCIGEEYEGAEHMSDRTLSDTEFGDISPISFLNETDGMKFDDKDSSIFSSSVKFQTNHHVSGENICSDSALTISMKSSGSENGKSSDGDVEKKDIVGNQYVKISHALVFHVECDGDNSKRDDNEVQLGSDSAFAPSSDSFSVDDGAMTVNENSDERVRRDFVVAGPVSMNITKKGVVSFIMENSKTANTPKKSSDFDDNHSNNTVESPSDEVFLAEREVTYFFVSDSEQNSDIPCENHMAGSEVINLCDTSQDTLNDHHVGAKTIPHPLNNSESQKISCDCSNLAHFDTEDSTNIDKPSTNVGERGDSMICEQAVEKSGNKVGIVDLIMSDPNNQCRNSDGVVSLTDNELNDLVDESLQLNNSPTKAGPQIVNVKDFARTANPGVAECSKLEDGFVETIDLTEEYEIRTPKSCIDKLSALCAKVIFEQQCCIKILDDVPFHKMSGVGFDIEPNLTATAPSSEVNLMKSDSKEKETHEGLSLIEETAILKRGADGCITKKCTLENMYLEQLMKMHSESGSHDVSNSDVGRPNSVQPETREKTGSLSNVQSTLSCNCAETAGNERFQPYIQDSEDYGYTDDSPYVTKKRPKKKRVKTKSRRSDSSEVNTPVNRQDQRQSTPFSSVVSTSYDTACANVTDDNVQYFDLPSVDSTPRFTYSALETARANLDLIRRVSTAKSITSSFDLSDTSPESQFSPCPMHRQLPLVYCNNLIADHQCLAWFDPQHPGFKSYSQGRCPPYSCYCTCTRQWVTPQGFAENSLPYFSNEYNSDESDLSGSFCAEDAVPNEYRLQLNIGFDRENQRKLSPSMEGNSDSAVGDENQDSLALRSPSKCPFNYGSPDLRSLFSEPPDQIQNGSPDSGYRADAETSLNTLPIGFDCPPRLSTIDQFLLLEKACDVAPPPPGSTIPSPYSSPDQSRTLYTIFENSET